MPGAWLHPSTRWPGHAISSIPSSHCRDSLKKEGEQTAIPGETDGRTGPREEGKLLKDFLSDNFWAEIQDTKFGLWIRDVATHLLKKIKHRGRSQESELFQNSNDSDAG